MSDDPLHLIDRLASAGMGASDDGGGGADADGVPLPPDLEPLTPEDVAGVVAASAAASTSASADLWAEATGSGVRTEHLSR